jgi:hypothetical protein
MMGKRNCLGIKQSEATRAKRIATLLIPEIRSKLGAANIGREPWNKGKSLLKEQQCL